MMTMMTMIYVEFVHLNPEYEAKRRLLFHFLISFRNSYSFLRFSTLMPWFIIFLGAPIVFFRWTNIKETTRLKVKIVHNELNYIMFAVHTSFVLSVLCSVFHSIHLHQNIYHLHFFILQFGSLYFQLKLEILFSRARILQLH